jgi:hypothetical protein
VLVALQEPDKEEDSMTLAEEFHDLETRRPSPGITASLLDPTTSIAERRQVLAHFAHCATHCAAHLTTLPHGNTSHCSVQSSSHDTPSFPQQPIAGTEVQPRQETSSSAVNFYENVATQTSPAESSTDTDSSLPSDSESDESEEDDAVEYDADAGYGVSTTLP